MVWIGARMRHDCVEYWFWSGSSQPAGMVYSRSPGQSDNKRNRFQNIPRNFDIWCTWEAFYSTFGRSGWASIQLLNGRIKALCIHEKTWQWVKATVQYTGPNIWNYLCTYFSISYPIAPSKETRPKTEIHFKVAGGMIGPHPTHGSGKA